MILFTRPTVHSLTSQKCQVSLPLRRRNRNHLGSIYFGALCVGADLACGLLTMEILDKSPYRMSLVFKDVEAKFLKRVDTRAVFTCTDGSRIEDLINKVHETGERQHTLLKVDVTGPDKYGDEILAEYHLTLSLKEK